MPLIEVAVNAISAVSEEDVTVFSYPKFPNLCSSGVQVVSMGLYMGQQAYLRSSWNVLDGFLVFVSLVDIVVSMAGGAKILGVLRVLRLLRTLRPLRSVLSLVYE